MQDAQLWLSSNHWWHEVLLFKGVAVEIIALSCTFTITSTFLWALKMWMGTVWMCQVARVRNALAFATHQFFRDQGFVWVASPIITASDCEGAGEQFCVTTLVLPLDFDLWILDFTCLCCKACLSVLCFLCHGCWCGIEDLPELSYNSMGIFIGSCVPYDFPSVFLHTLSIISFHLWWMLGFGVWI